MAGTQNAEEVTTHKRNHHGQPTSRTDTNEHIAGVALVVLYNGVSTTVTLTVNQKNVSVMLTVNR